MFNIEQAGACVFMVFGDMTAADYSTVTTLDAAGSAKGLREVLPILATVFISFLTIGMAMPVYHFMAFIYWLGFGTAVGDLSRGPVVTAAWCRARGRGNLLIRADERPPSSRVFW